MAKKNRNRNRNRPVTPPSQRRENGSAARRFIDVPPPIAGDDLSHISLSAAAAPPPPPPPPAEDDDDGSPEAKRESRANSVKRALRSKLLFPISMLEQINNISTEMSSQLKLSTCLERWLGLELARSMVQADKGADLLVLDDLRVIERVGTSFDDDSSERTDRLAARLATQPYTIQRALARTKHGALFLVNAWTLLGDVIESSGGLDDSQIQTAYDLMGIDHVYRKGSSQVPAGTDTVGLRSLVAREIGRHRSRLDQALNARSECEKKNAQMGFVKFRDAESRGVRSDLNRARKRISWCMDTINMLKKGADPSQILDPETGLPVAVGPPLSAVPEPSRPATAPPPPPPPPPSPSSQSAPAPAAPATPFIPPPPPGCSEEVREMWLVAAGAVLNKSATPPSDEPGPPPTA